jgi:hypothetical protein
MDLPPCPICGTELQEESRGGHARCPECGFVTPVDVDADALHALLEEATAPLGGQTHQLGPRLEADDKRLASGNPPSMLDAPETSPVPSLPSPTPSRELASRAPPPLEDPRGQLPKSGSDVPKTPLESELDDSQKKRGRNLKPRGELLR